MRRVRIDLAGFGTPCERCHADLFERFARGDRSAWAGRYRGEGTYASHGMSGVTDEVTCWRCGHKRPRFFEVEREVRRRKGARVHDPLRGDGKKARHSERRRQLLGGVE